MKESVMNKKDLQGIDELVFTLSWTRVNGFQECGIGVGRDEGSVSEEAFEAVNEYLMPLIKEQLDQLMETLDAVMIPNICHCRKDPEYDINSLIEEETA